MKILNLIKATLVSGCLMLVSTLLLQGCASEQENRGEISEQSLSQQFHDPPAEARPRVWWHWMNGNISVDGIAKDLEWMQRVGIGGVQNFDAAMNTPVIVDNRLPFMSPEWQQAFRFAVEKSDALGLEFAIASSPGWSLTGGPWVAPDDAMKKLVWSERIIQGGAAVDEILPAPPSVPGPYQTLTAQHKHAHNPEVIPASFYRDTRVLAYPITQWLKPAAFEVYVNGEQINAASLADRDLATGIALPEGKGRAPAVLEMMSEQPQVISSAVLYVRHLPASIMRGPLQPTLQFMNSAGNWQDLAVIRLGDVPATVSFEPVSAARFRLVFGRGTPSSPFQFAPTPGIDPSALMGLGSMAPKQALLAEFRLLNSPRVHAFEVKAGFEHLDNYHTVETLTGNTSGVRTRSVRDITQYMDAEGRLRWEAPPGTWKVLRLGYSLTGKTNSPATVEATGLEVDKLDSAAVERYIRHYLGLYQKVVGKALIGTRGLNALLTDSAEAGPANWTPQIVERFKELRGYDPVPWLPTLTGEIIASARESDHFLNDFRRTLAELNASEHYGTIARVAQEFGLTLYGEALEANRAISPLGDDLDMRRYADIPMAAMWSYRKDGEPNASYRGDMRGAASVAHIYGKPIVAAESLTSILAPWAHGPAELQPMIDAEFLHGINRPVIHTSPHQPVDDKVPGLSLHVFGQYFTRHETWAEMAKPWMDYIARSSFLLQQGRNVADVAYFYGEDAPLGVLAATEGYPSDVPVSYAYDFVSAYALVNEFKVRDGALVTRGGARYQALYLGEQARQSMSVKVLKHIARLVDQGAIVIGMPPQRQPGLSGDDAEFHELVKQLWPESPQVPEVREQVIASRDIEATLLSQGRQPDLQVHQGDAIPFVHRSLPQGDIYYIANRSDSPRNLAVDFRVTGKAPSLWRATDASISPVSYQIGEASTRVSMALQPWESVFVVFIEPTAVTRRYVAQSVKSELLHLDGAWEVSFQAQRGAPTGVVLNSLESLSEHENPAIRYFSGVATYRKSFRLPDLSVAKNLTLDLGAVGDIAEVYLNGQSVGTAWKSPYRLTLDAQLKVGDNELTVKVANLWANRLIGDRQPNAQAITFTSFKTYLPNAPLRPSGLIGPVRILAEESGASH